VTVRIICAGRPLASHEQAWIDDYLKRMKKLGRVDVVRVKEKSRASASATAAATWADMESHLSPKSWRVVLESGGEDLSTEGLAAVFEKAVRQSKGDLEFVIGGAYGLPPEAKASARTVWSVGRLTLPHRIVLLLVVEQIYRVLSMRAGLPYHHAG
jgi:23S rRNA (pseudouridine1915-N3)-methyltransferase